MSLRDLQTGKGVAGKRFYVSKAWAALGLETTDVGVVILWPEWSSGTASPAWGNSVGMVKTTQTWISRGCLFRGGQPLLFGRGSKMGGRVGKLYSEECKGLSYALIGGCWPGKNRMGLTGGEHALWWVWGFIFDLLWFVLSRRSEIRELACIDHRGCGLAFLADCHRGSGSTFSCLPWSSHSLCVCIFSFSQSTAFSKYWN